MCGIAGVINIKDGINIENFKKMTTTIKHRGPDDEGYFLTSSEKSNFAYGIDTINTVKMRLNTSIDDLINQKFSIALGHRRLSIIDVSDQGHQPMSYSDTVIVYNGEIYNYLELRSQLQELGYTFKTDGDTEVIIQAYRHWGEECVKYFNGMWAFALWDKTKKKMFCSRDKLGEKPFYYFLSKDKLVFGSEIKQILEYGIKAKVNEEIMHVFLVSGFHDFGEETFFENIFSLPGGYNLSIQFDDSLNSIDVDRYQYWTLNVYGHSDVKSFEDACQKIGNGLEESIALRLRSDVKIGSCLSGGLDSSSVVTIACEKLGVEKEKFNTFTACYDHHKEVDETYYSDKIVENSACKNTKVKPSIEKLQNDFEKLVWHQDEPFASLGIFASWCVMEAAGNESVKVLLDGQGGDETLLGYERFYAYFLKEKLTKMKFHDFYQEFKLSAENSKLNLKYLLGYFMYFNNKTIRKTRVLKRTEKFLNASFAKKYRALNKVDHLFSFKNLEEAQHAELVTFISHLLRYEDRNSMAHSIEARVPFLEPNFVEEALQIPNHYKLRDGWTKAGLRAYMKNKMPHEVAYRKNKLGFSVPQEAWLNDLNDYFKNELLDNPRSSRFFNMDFIKKIFNNKTHVNLRFKFIMIETWMRAFDLD